MRAIYYGTDTTPPRVTTLTKVGPLYKLTFIDDAQSPISLYFDHTGLQRAIKRCGSSVYPFPTTYLQMVEPFLPLLPTITTGIWLLLHDEGTYTTFAATPTPQSLVETEGGEELSPDGYYE